MNTDYTNQTVRCNPEATICYGQALYLPGPKMDVSDIHTKLLALPWRTERTARHECFMSDKKLSYSYGGKGTEKPPVYEAIPMNLTVGVLMGMASYTAGCVFNACFLNKYDDQHQHLGWHVDNFPGMDPNAPIAVLSFGAEREIWLKDKRGFECLKCGGSGCLPVSEAEGAANGYPICDCGGQGFTSAPPKGRQPANQRVKLGETSLFIMPPGYQENYFHRIPKHDRPCGWRISLTFRKFF